MSKLDLITYPCHACDDLHHAIPEDTKEQIKALMLELVEKSVYTKKGSAIRYIDEQELVTDIEAL